MTLILPYSTEHVVIGATLEALAFAYINRYPIVWTTNTQPHMFDHFLAGLDLSPWLLDNPVRKLNTTDGRTLEIGSNKEALHAYIRLALAMEGFALAGDTVNRIRINQEKQELKLYHKRGTKSSRVYYRTLHVFDDRHIEGLPSRRKNHTQQLEIIDWFHCKNFKLHEFDTIPIDTGKFAHTALFYKSFRSGFIKDMVVMSSLTLNQLKDSDYSDAMVRMKLESVMADLPFYSANRAKRLECHKREIIYKMGHAASTEKIKFHYDSFGSLAPTDHMRCYTHLFDER